MGDLASGPGLAVAGLVINTVWEIRTAREEPDDSGSAEPEISDEANKGIDPNFGANNCRHQRSLDRIQSSGEWRSQRRNPFGSQ